MQCSAACQTRVSSASCRRIQARRGTSLSDWRTGSLPFPEHGCFSPVKLRPKNFKRIPGSICAPRGFRRAAVFCDIKKLGTGAGSEKGRKDDLALIVSDVPAAVAGMFTTNQVCAAPVKVSAQRAGKNFARAIVVNSGNANACTGRQGMHDAQEIARVAAEAVAAVYDRRKNSSDPESFQGRYKTGARDVLVCSTGRIGVPMPMKNVASG